MVEGIAVEGLVNQALGIGNTVLYVVLGLFVVIIVTVLGIWAYRRKKWNLVLNVKIPRMDGRFIGQDKAKGYWDSDEGWIMVKRKGYKPVPSRPIDPKKWLQSKNEATLVQVGPQDYIIALEDSYNILTGEDGKSYALMDIMADVGKRKTWKNYTERQAKKAFSLGNWLKENAWMVSTGIVIFIIFIGFAVIWTRLPTICPGAAG